MYSVSILENDIKSSIIYLINALVPKPIQLSNHLEDFFFSAHTVLCRIHREWDKLHFLYVLMISFIWALDLVHRISMSTSSSVPRPCKCKSGITLCTQHLFKIYVIQSKALNTKLIYFFIRQSFTHSQGKFNHFSKVP